MENGVSPFEVKAVRSILRNATRKEDEPINILLGSAHERYQECLSKTGHNFYIVPFKGSHIWNTKYAPIPHNFIILPANLPEWIDFDLVLCQSKDHYSIMKKFSKIFNIPLVCLEHTFPPPNWGHSELNHAKSLRGHLNVFICESSRNAFGWTDKEAYVIRHGIDTDKFKPTPNTKKYDHILTVCNDFIKRDWMSGYTLWTQLIKNLPYKVLGNTPGLSVEAKSTDELINHYREASIFLNTTIASPIPMSLLEAMACGCAIVTTGTCMIPEIIENGINGYMSNDKDELKGYLVKLLKDPEDRKRIGENARKTIIEKFDLNNFIKEWDKLFRTLAGVEVMYEN